MLILIKTQIPYKTLMLVEREMLTLTKIQTPCKTLMLVIYGNLMQEKTLILTKMQIHYKTQTLEDVMLTLIKIQTL